jgi:hypothetical protein
MVKERCLQLHYLQKKTINGFCFAADMDTSASVSIKEIHAKHFS